MSKHSLQSTLLLLTIRTAVTGCLLLATFLSTPGFGQQLYQESPEGPQYFDRAMDEIMIKFVKGTGFEAQQRLLAEESLLQPITRDQLLPAPVVTFANIQPGTSQEAIDALLSRVSLLPEVVYANQVLIFADGTRQVLQDEVLVKLLNPSHTDRLKSVASSMGLSIVRENQFERGLYHLRVGPHATGNALEVANAMHKTGLFEYAEPDWLRMPKGFSTNDPMYSDQWSIENTGSSAQYNGTPGNDMDVVNAWGITTGAASIKVAILDEGVDLTHPDLLANMLGGYDATGQGSGGNMSGNDAHGTACAGIVAAVGNNNLGTAGIAYNCKIVPVRIAYSNAQGNWVTSNSWIGNALNWSWQTAGADILSNSWGGGSYSSTIVSAINNAWNSGRGGLGAPVIFAAGNDNSSVSFPATQTNTIAVAAMSMCEERKNPSSCDGESWWGSNYGSSLDIAAPGVKIACSDISGSAGYSSGDYTGTFNGTSSACPNAAGVMALVLSTNPALTGQQARDAIETTCDKVGGYTYNSSVTGQPNGTWSNDLGYGRVNAYQAVLSVQSSTADDAGISNINEPAGVVCGSTLTPDVALQNFGNNSLTSVTINYQLDGGTVNTYSWSGNLSAGSGTNVTLPSIPLTDGQHTLDVWTSNPNGNTDSNTNNDAFQAVFSSGSNTVQITLTFDDYPEETSWQIVDQTSLQVVASGGTYSTEPDGSTLVIDVCLSSSCFDFTISDVYGDGMCCTYGNGSYLVQSNGTTLASGGSFTASETTGFCLPVGGTPVAASIASSTNVSCNGATDGGATAAASGGTSPYTYAWSNGQSGAVLSGVGAGNYTVTVTDNGGQTDVASVGITEPSPLTNSYSQTNVDCAGNSNGSIDITVSGGTVPYSYSWSNGATTQDLSGLSAGSYSLTVTDNNGCQTYRTATITEPSAIGLSVSTVDVTVQGGSDGSATVSASGGTPGYSYNWSNGSTSATAANLAAGTYTVTVTDANGCTATDNAVIQDGPPAGGCTTTITSFPYTETFEGNNVGQWVQETGDDLNWTVNSGSTPSSSTGPSAAAQGTYYAYIEASSPNYPSKTAILSSPCFDLTGLSTAELSFAYHLYGSNMGSLEVQASTDGGNTWSAAIWSLSGDQGNSWGTANVSLNAYVGNTVSLRYVGTTGTGWQSDICIDDVQIAQGAAPTYCASQGNDATYEWIETITVGGLTNTSGGNGGYADFTAQSVSLSPGASASVSLTPGFSGSTYQEYWIIWIDYNQDGDFSDAGEQVYTSSASSTTVTGSFTVPAAAQNGSTRMRISMKWNAAPTACEAFSYGEVEDYTVIIGSAAKPTPAVTQLEVDESPRVQLFPNPASSYINIGFIETWNEPVTVTIYNYTGSVIATERVDSGARLHRLNTSNLAAGNYLMVLQSEHYSNAQRFTVVR